MRFQDVAFPPLRASFPQCFLKIVVEVKASGPPHVLKLVWGKQGYVPCKTLLLLQSLFLCQSNLMEIIRQLQRWGESGHPLISEDGQI